jgi:hypothetical protein
VKLAAHLYLTPKLRMHGASPPLPDKSHIQAIDSDQSKRPYDNTKLLLHIDTL